MTRRRYVCRINEETGLPETIEVGGDYTGAERRAPKATEEGIFGNVQATDGTPLNTKRRHEEYMKRHGLGLVHEATETLAKAKARREDVFLTGGDHRERREQVGRAMYETLKRGRR